VITPILIGIVAGIIAGAIVGRPVYGPAVYRKRGEAQLEDARRFGPERQSSKTPRESLSDARVRESRPRGQGKKRLGNAVRLRSPGATAPRREMKKSEQRLQQKEENLDKKTQQVDSRHRPRWRRRDRALNDREEGGSRAARERARSADRRPAPQARNRWPALTVEEAKRELIRGHRE